MDSGGRSRQCEVPESGSGWRRGKELEGVKGRQVEKRTGQGARGPREGFCAQVRFRPSDSWGRRAGTRELWLMGGQGSRLGERKRGQWLVLGCTVQE